MMAEACFKTGLSDFGAAPFQDGLTVFLDSVQNEANLPDKNAAAVIALILRRLTNRLEIEEWLRTHPEVSTLDIAGPVSITGLPRTGTSALANIMALDDGFRGLRGWEQAQPVPPPILAEEQTDPRRLAAVEAIEQLLREQPEQRAMHLYDVDGDAEDPELQGLTFRAIQLALPIFKYHIWWRDADLRPAFAYHRRVAQLLQSRRPPNRWLFKAPSHNFHLESIVSAYPDARFLITHRDPAEAIASTVSFVWSLNPRGSGSYGTKENFGRHLCEHFRIGMQKAIAARARIGEHRFFDIYHRDFVHDPLGTLDRIYNFLNLELRPHIREKMARWHMANKSGAHGTHRYTPEEYGLSVPQLRSDFGFYIRRFDVSLES
jgi:hypothetical protein